MERNTAIILASVLGVAAAGAAAAAVTVALKRRKPSPIVQVPQGGASAQQCQAQCSADPQCTVAHFKPSDGTCTLSHTDPALDWKEDPDWTAYVRRDKTSPALKWQDWTPASCPTGCSEPVDMTRACSVDAKCPGPYKRHCDTHECGTMDLYTGVMANSWELVPQQLPLGQKLTFPTATIPDVCMQMCAKDDRCTALIVEHKHNDFDHVESCQLLQQDTERGPPTGLRENINGASGNILIHPKIPVDHQGMWKDIDPQGCQNRHCGQPFITPRECATGQGMCSGGVDHIECVEDRCAYDVFSGLAPI